MPKKKKNKEITKPLLAGAIEDTKLLDWGDDKRYRYFLGTPKIDGIRAVRVAKGLVSRSFKPIRNTFIRTELEKILPIGADGEIVVGNTFQEVTSGVMRESGEPDFKYYWFDWVKNSLDDTYMQRVMDFKNRELKDPNHRIIRVLPTIIRNADELVEFETKCLADGFEGVILRDPYGVYKCGRSTFKQKILLKLKRFVDSEAKIIGFVELEHNLNEAKKDNFGRTERSSAKAGKVAAGTFGKFQLKDLKTGIEFDCGTGKGLTHKLRQEIWDDQLKYKDQIVKYKYFPVGVKEKPRHPVFLGFRDTDDM